MYFSSDPVKKKIRIMNEQERNLHVEDESNTVLGQIADQYGVGYSQYQGNLPEVHQFLENPSMLQPRPEFLGGMQFDDGDDTVLTHAVKTQNIPAVQSLVNAGADPNQANKKGITPISAAAHKGNTVIMKILIDAGATVNALKSPGSGSTPLIQAAHFGHVEAVRILVKHNAVADFANSKGTTALMRASQEGHVEICTILIKAEADVNRKNNEGMNALMLASQRGHADMATLLINSGACMDEQTSQGSTALMLACKRGHGEVVKVLVQMGAEIFVRDSKGRTAYETARKRQHENLLPYLNTQVQIRLIQEMRLKTRGEFLREIRVAFEKDSLRMSESVCRALSVLKPQSTLLEQTPTAVFSAGRGITSSHDSTNMRRGSCGAGAGSSSSSSSSISSRATIVTSARKGASLLSDSFPHESEIGVSAEHQSSADFECELLSSGSPSLNKWIGGASHIGASLTPRGASGGSPGSGSGLLMCTHTAYAHQFNQSSNLPSSSRLRSSIAAIPVLPPMLPRRPDYEDWCWPLLLLRCLELPHGVYDLIIDMLPLPRVWEKSLKGLGRRCKCAPQQAVSDITAIMDEILIDACIFPGKDQQGQLVRINKNIQIHEDLAIHLGINPSLIESLCEWSDVQSLSMRCKENDITFRYPMAKKLHSVAIALFKWQVINTMPSLYSFPL